MTAEYGTTSKCILFSTHLRFVWVSLVAQMIKIPPAIQETCVWSLGLEDPLQKEMATHSSILAWGIPWTEEPGRLQSMRSQSWTQLSDLIHSFALYSVCASSLLESIVWWIRDRKYIFILNVQETYTDTGYVLGQDKSFLKGSESRHVMAHILRSQCSESGRNLFLNRPCHWVSNHSLETLQ